MKDGAAKIGAADRLLRLGLENVGPGWFTSIMGTGILAVCIAISPVALPFGPIVSLLLWATATLLFAVFAVLWAASAVRRPRAAFAGLLDPATAQAWGAPPMACFTVAVGLLKIGIGVLPAGVCVAAAQVLWVAGAAGSLASALSVPYLMFTRHDITTEKTFGNWLLPVVPPIVASVPAALLLPAWPAAVRGDMLAFAYALLGIGMMLAAIVIVIFYGRLIYHKIPAGPLVPTMWIVVGPLGQSIAGIIALGTAAQAVWPELGHGLLLAGVAYGVLAWGFAVYWLTMAIAVTLRAARTHLPFSLGWWAFTFPVGVLTAGTDALYAQTHADLFAAAAAFLVTLLAALWVLVAHASLRGILGAVAPPARTQAGKELSPAA